jgi:hypothetical protein
VSVRDDSCHRKKKLPTAYIINSDHATATKAAKAKGCVPGDSGKKKVSTVDFFCCPASVRPPL